MNIIVFGKDGQLGKAFKAFFDASKLDEIHRIEYVGRAECDLVYLDAIAELLNRIKPDLLINAAAYTDVDKSESEIDLAYTINAKAPKIMAQYALVNGATLLHYSTDYVFDGSKGSFYTEDDQRNPLGIYGKSKAAGEEEIESTFANLSVQSPALALEWSKSQYAIFRTSWVYGDGDNFIRTILRLAKERDELRIISDQYGVPTSAEWLAGIGLDLVLGKDGKMKRFSSGVYHAVPSGRTTRYGLANLVVRSAIEEGVRLKTKPDAIKPILAIEFQRPAPRPLNSSMATDKLYAALKNSVDGSKIKQLNQPWEKLVKIYVKGLVKDGLLFKRV